MSDRTRRPRRRLSGEVLAGLLALVVLVAGGVGVAVVQGGNPQNVRGAVTAPPWGRPATDQLETRAAAAGLENVWGQDLAMHVHAHLSITVDGQAVTVPGDIGHDSDEKFAAEIHTHDTSGIVHVESPTRETFVLGQLFTEWDVALDGRGVGSLGHDDGLELHTFVGGSPYTSDPAGIPLRDFERIDLVLAPVGETVTAPAAFAWPPDYR
jgi:hypothetical protein